MRYHDQNDTDRSQRRRRWRTVLTVAVAVSVASPISAFATHRFRDVPDDYTHAPGIEWLVGAGVTAGCGDGTDYCPETAVNRGQMGTFLRRLAGGDPAVAPSVNAATVQGMTPAQLRGQRGPAGPAGQDGARGPAGPAGPAGPTEVAEVVYESRGPVPVPANGSADFTVPCEEGAAVGGGHDGQRGVSASASFPYQEDGSSGWQGTLENTTGAPIDVPVWAVCLVTG